MNKERQARKEAFRESIIWTDKKRTAFLGLPLSFTKYILTKDRLIIRRGFLNVKEDEVRLYRVMDLSLRRSLGQRLFGIGTIHVCSADQSMGDFDIINIKHPADFKELFSNAIETERVEKRVSNRENLFDTGGENPHMPPHFDDQGPQFHEPDEGRHF